MPRTYIKKKETPTYSVEDIRNAERDMLNRNFTYRQAQDIYGVPKAVIYNRIKGRRTSLEVMGPGHCPVLNPTEEQEIVQCLLMRAKMGHPCL